jgi:hypothetical protein
MNGSRWLVVLVVTAAAASLAADAVRAEGFVDGYLGGAFVPDNPVTISALNQSSSEKINFKGAMLYGGRAGYWLESVPWLGLSVTGSYFSADEKSRGKSKNKGDTGGHASRLELDVIPVSALLMLRYPLMKGDDFPHGEFYPYLGVGPAVFITKLRQQLDVFNSPLQIRDTNVAPGVDLRTGIGFFFPNDSWFYFTEFRFTHVGSTYYYDDVGGLPAKERVGARDTLGFAFGVGFHF